MKLLFGMKWIIKRLLKVLEIKMFMLKLSNVINWELFWFKYLSNGTKLAPLVVFKGKTGGPLEKEL